MCSRDSISSKNLTVRVKLQFHKSQSSCYSCGISFRHYLFVSHMNHANYFSLDLFQKIQATLPIWNACYNILPPWNCSFKNLSFTFSRKILIAFWTLFLITYSVACRAVEHLWWRSTDDNAEGFMFWHKTHIHVIKLFS